MLRINWIEINEVAGVMGRLQVLVSLYESKHLIEFVH